MRRHSDLHQSAAISAVLLVLLFALPLAVVVPFQTELFSDDPIAVESEREPFQPGDLDAEMVLKVLVGDTVEEMSLGEYLVGVVRAEMPASFEPEALKAQAICARSYAYNNISQNKHSAHHFDVCSSTDCQVYRGAGSNVSSYQSTDRTDRAVEETAG